MTSSDNLAIQVSFDGNPIDGLLKASVSANNYFSADTYSLTFAMTASAGSDITFWSALSSAYVEVTAVTSSSYGSTHQSLITGMIDTIQVDPIRAVAGVEGRDLSSALIDSYRQQDFVNQTASEIVSAIAQYHDLQPNVTATSGIIGRYYGDGYTKLSLGQFSRAQSDWDLLVQLARQNGFDLFVQDNSLYFQESNASSDTPISISMYDVQHIRVDRDLNVLANSVARVQSWNSQNMAAYQSNGPDNSNARTTSSTTRALPFLFSASNYTSQQVADAAGRYTTELGQLGTALHLDMPWNLSLSPRTQILLCDTDSQFDSLYRIDSLERRYCATSGSVQSIRAVQI